MRSLKDKLLLIYHLLYKSYGKQNWWPVDKDYHRKMGTDPREEIVIGAILTQNTAWKNVEKALENLKNAQALSFEGILNMPIEKLQELIRPAGYFRLKAKRLKEVVGALTPVDKVKTIGREELLSINGVGRETADVILLYAGERPFFVIDAYTRRIVNRVLSVDGSYEDLRGFFETNLPKDVELYKEFHALLDEHAKRFCRKVPVCEGCPLTELCEYSQKGLK